MTVYPLQSFSLELIIAQSANIIYSFVGIRMILRKCFFKESSCFVVQTSLRHVLDGGRRGPQEDAILWDVAVFTARSFVNIGTVNTSSYLHVLALLLAGLHQFHVIKPQRLSEWN